MDPVPLNEAQEMTKLFLETPLDASITDNILGNAPPRVKELPVKWLAIFLNSGNGFCGQLADSLKVTEVWIVPSANDPEKLEGKVVCEIVVTPGMCTPNGVLHQGMTGFLIDECSTLCMVVGNAGEGRNTPPGVSCSFNLLFHAQALCGTTLRIVNHSLGAGWAANSGRTEVWDKDNHRLIASGTQLTMPPSGAGNWMN